jgi:hypothetical protein
VVSICTKQRLARLRQHFGGELLETNPIFPSKLKRLTSIEHVAKWKKKQTEIKEAGKEKAVDVGLTIADAVTPQDSKWKKEVLEGRKRQKEKEQQKEEEQPKEEGDQSGRGESSDGGEDQDGHETTIGKRIQQDDEGNQTSSEKDNGMEGQHNEVHNQTRSKKRGDGVDPSSG